MKKGLLLFGITLFSSMASTCSCMMRRALTITRKFSASAPRLVNPPIRRLSTFEQNLESWYPPQASDFYEEIGTTLQVISGEIGKERLESILSCPKTRETLRTFFYAQDSMIRDYEELRYPVPRQFPGVLRECSKKLGCVFSPGELEKLTQEGTIRESVIRFLLASSKMCEEKGEGVALRYSQEALENMYCPWFEGRTLEELRAESEESGEDEALTGPSDTDALAPLTDCA